MVGLVTSAVATGCGPSSRTFNCVSASTQTWQSPNAGAYAETEDLGGLGQGNVHDPDPDGTIDQSTASTCAQQLLAKLPVHIMGVQAALDNMHPDDEAIVADQMARQMRDQLLNDLAKTRAGRLLIFHLYLDATGVDKISQPNPAGPGGDIVTSNKLMRMLFASFPRFQYLFSETPLNTPAAQNAANSQGLQWQALAGGSGPYRFDDFTLIAQLPQGLTPQAFLSQLAADMNKTVNNRQFDNLSQFVRRQKGPPAVGDVYDIYLDNAVPDKFIPIPGNPVPVMTVEIDSTHLVAQTMQGHVLNGIREWGYYQLKDGRLLIYTRAISRDATWIARQPARSIPGHGAEIQARLWAEFMVGLCNQIQRIGGACNPSSGQAGDEPWTRRLNLGG